MSSNQESKPRLGTAAMGVAVGVITALVSAGISYGRGAASTESIRVDLTRLESRQMDVLQRLSRIEAQVQANTPRIESIERRMDGR